MSFADLHLHTTASDGVLTPSQVVGKAKEKGFKAIAITDHDTTAGLQAALDAGIEFGLEVVPGIELSTLSGDREIHLLGYYPDRQNRRLQDTLSEMIDTRRNRAVKMIEKLNGFGLELNLNRVKEIAGSEFIGRPHIAHALLEKKYISDISEAFSKNFIGRGGRAYVERYKISPVEGIEILLQAGAVPVLAHPGFLSAGPPIEEQELLTLVSEGLLGVEVYYGRHTKEQVEVYKQLAVKYGMLITGGSDCHGNFEADNRLGSVKLPYKYVETLKKQKSLISTVAHNKGVS